MGLNSDKIIALAGNPNVGKSTVFNALTGLRQHTGNWPGKTVAVAQGRCTYKQKNYVIVDLPGCYSLMARSAEEETARDFICAHGADTIIVVCNASSLERSLNLVLQILEITSHVVVCVNLMDEAIKHGLTIDLPALSSELGVPVIGAAARNRNGLDELMDAAAAAIEAADEAAAAARAASEDTTTGFIPPFRIQYPEYLEDALSSLDPCVRALCGTAEVPWDFHSRWLSLMLLQQDQQNGETFFESPLKELFLSGAPMSENLVRTLKNVRANLIQKGITPRQLKDDVVSGVVHTAEDLCRDIVGFDGAPDPMAEVQPMVSTLDKILTGKRTAFPIMILVLLGVFWLTIVGANYPSQVIGTGLFWLEDQLLFFLQWLHVPEFLSEMLVLGVYRVLAWVVSVMLPPMAIFFPLFTLLEDAGFLPRIAFNLDKWFKKCSACGKQALTMCMGFGCNAAGVIGCRIIDSPRERLIAILTNNLVPCNGRFPALIAILSMFFIGIATRGSGAIRNSLLSAALLTAVIILGICMTFLASKLLSRTVLKGTLSSFALELPPYRKPQIGKVLVRSLLDRTLFVLGRAVSVAAPAGLIIWLMANITIADQTLLAHCSNFLDPFAQLLGMDGVILLAFILGFPANEIVIPIMIMAYMAQGNILELDNLATLKLLLVNNGWTWATAISFMLFSLLHWPCSTTCLTIKKETQSLKWTLLAIALPTIMGILVCMLFTSLVRLIGL